MECKFDLARECDCCRQCAPHAEVAWPCGQCGEPAQYSLPGGEPICLDCWRGMAACEQLELIGAEELVEEW